MDRGAVAVAVAVALVAAAAACAGEGAQPPATTRPPGPWRVMPLGDSITAGFGHPGAYRGFLADDLAAAGVEVDFVGSQRDGAGEDPEHEGHSGWCISDTPKFCYGTEGEPTGLLERVDGWIDAAAPVDVVVVQAGLNHLASAYAEPDRAPDAAGAMRALLDRIRRRLPSALVVVMPITIPSMNPEQQAFNDALVAEVERRAQRGEPIVFADVRSVNRPEQFVDDWHPGEAGYRAMAGVLAAVLADRLGRR